jgi:hypothetical protein
MICVICKRKLEAEQSVYSRFTKNHYCLPGSGCWIFRKEDECGFQEDTLISEEEGELIDQQTKDLNEKEQDSTLSVSDTDHTSAPA